MDALHSLTDHSSKGQGLPSVSTFLRLASFVWDFSTLIIAATFNMAERQQCRALPQSAVRRGVERRLQVELGIWNGFFAIVPLHSHDVQHGKHTGSSALKSGNEHLQDLALCSL